MPKKVIPQFLRWKKKNLELPAIPSMAPEQMLDHYSLTYPELATATIKELGIIDGKLIYEIDETLGTKG